MTALSHIRHSLPVWQSRILLGAGVAALVAAALGSGAYALQTATSSQELAGIPTDAVIKTALAVAADVGVAFGAAVTAWLWLSGRKGLRVQSYFAAGMTAFALVVAASNLSGYSAWTRQQHAADAAHANPLYALAEANARRAATDPSQYLTGSDRRLLLDGQTPDTAKRDGGDWLKAFALHALILGFGFAYRLPTQVKRKKAATKSVKRQGTPKLRVVNE